MCWILKKFIHFKPLLLSNCDHILQICNYFLILTKKPPRSHHHHRPNHRASSNFILGPSTQEKKAIKKKWHQLACPVLCGAYQSGTRPEATPHRPEITRCLWVSLPSVADPPRTLELISSDVVCSSIRVSSLCRSLTLCVRWIEMCFFYSSWNYLNLTSLFEVSIIYCRKPLSLTWWEYFRQVLITIISQTKTNETTIFQHFTHSAWLISHRSFFFLFHRGKLGKSVPATTCGALPQDETKHIFRKSPGGSFTSE